MSVNIEDFVNSLPAFESSHEAFDAYRKAESPKDLVRIELEGAYDLSEAGIKMVYALGRGDGEYLGKRTNLMYYLPCFVTNNFFGNDREKRDISSIPVDRIASITPLVESDRVDWKSILVEDKKLRVVVGNAVTSGPQDA